MAASAPAMPAVIETSPTSERTMLRAIIAAGAVILIVHLWVALTRSINWDEFHHFDLIRRYAAGTLDAPLQTFHVHLFGWLANLPLEPTAQIRAGRLVMLACLCGATFAIYGLATRFASRPAAALAALAWLSGGFVLGHGTAFRADPMTTVLLVTALWLLACRRLNLQTAVAAGALVGFASIITIKTVFYAPAFAAIAWLRWHEGERAGTVRAAIVAGLVAFASFALLYLWHTAQLTTAPPDAAVATTRSAWDTVFSEGFLPQSDALWKQVTIAPHLAVLVCLAPLAWWWMRIGWARTLILLGLMLPLATVVFYRNAYPYYYVFILPPVLVATVPVIELLVRRYYSPLFGLALALFSIHWAMGEPRGTLDGQRQTIAVARQLFPQPVTYIDFAGSLGSQRRATDYMLSGWGLKVYYERGVPELSLIMSREPVPLLVVNHPVLDAAMAGSRPDERLMDADADALRQNFIPHWGRLYVAGKDIAAGSEPTQAEFLVPGTYTLEGGPLEIDGIAYRPGDFVTLSRGPHHIGGGRAVKATLRWGRNLPKPAEAPLPVPPFDGF